MDRVEDHVTKSVDYTEVAHKELKQAQEYQLKARKVPHLLFKGLWS